MPRPNKNNHYVKIAIRTWYLRDYTFCLIESLDKEGNYLVRVFPERDVESYWKPGGRYETESGAAWAILNYLEDKDLKSEF